MRRSLTRCTGRPRRACRSTCGSAGSARCAPAFRVSPKPSGSAAWSAGSSSTPGSTRSALARKTRREKSGSAALTSCTGTWTGASSFWYGSPSQRTGPSCAALSILRWIPRLHRGRSPTTGPGLAITLTRPGRRCTTSRTCWYEHGRAGRPMRSAPPARLIRAAGAVVWAPGPDGIQVALISRRRYGDWTFPKGKCEPGEHVLETAIREVQEETGLPVILGRPLSHSTYERNGLPKRVDYWAAACREAPSAFVPNEEFDELEWLGVHEAAGRLSYEHDRAILAMFASGPAQSVPWILVRHASAGSKSRWAGDELARPLDARGAAGAVSSAAARCVATVAPYAARTGAKIELEPLFSPDQADQARAAARVSAIAAEGLPTVICAHRENMPVLLQALCARLGSPMPAGPPLRKGGFWVLHTAGERLVATEQPRPAES